VLTLHEQHRVRTSIFSIDQTRVLYPQPFQPPTYLLTYLLISSVEQFYQTFLKSFHHLQSTRDRACAYLLTYLLTTI